MKGKVAKRKTVSEGRGMPKRVRVSKREGD
jgi:hypothetical protein